MKIGRSLNVLPPMRCDADCDECCGPVPVTRAQLARVAAFVKAHGIQPKPQGETCPLFLGGRCSVYPVRPPVCVAFGHSERLPCARGYNTNVSEEIIARMVAPTEPFTGFIYDLLDDVPEEARTLMRELGPVVGVERAPP